MERGVLGDWPAFPPELLKELADASPEGAKLRFVLLGGGAVVSSRIVRQTELGLVVETTEGTLTAVPWHSIARVDAVRPDVGKPVGFRAG